MRLKDYLYMKEMKMSTFAKMMNVSTHHIRMVVHKKYKPSIKLAIKIVDATEGLVSLDELLTDKKFKGIFGED